MAGCIETINRPNNHTLKLELIYIVRVILQYGMVREVHKYYTIMIENKN